jgi:hypothetical protein
MNGISVTTDSLEEDPRINRFWDHGNMELSNHVREKSRNSSSEREKAVMRRMEQGFETSEVHIVHSDIPEDTEMFSARFKDVEHGMGRKRLKDGMPVRFENKGEYSLNVLVIISKKNGAHKNLLVEKSVCCDLARASIISWN